MSIFLLCINFSIFQMQIPNYGSSILRHILMYDGGKYVNFILFDTF